MPIEFYFTGLLEMEDMQVTSHWLCLQCKRPLALPGRPGAALSKGSETACALMQNLQNAGLTLIFFMSLLVAIAALVLDGP